MFSIGDDGLGQYDDCFVAQAIDERLEDMDSFLAERFGDLQSEDVPAVDEIDDVPAFGCLF